MKKFPKKLQWDYTQVVPETFNENVEHYAGELNGGLDSTNLPVDSLSFKKFEPVTITDLSAGDVKKFKWEAATQTYYESTKYQNLDSDTTWHDTIIDLDLKTYNWGKNWNKLEAIGQFDDIFIQDQMVEGMLSGCARINFRHGVNVVTYISGETTLHAQTGFDWWTRWGVFVNDVLVAESGECYPRGENLVIPFSIPVGSQKVRIDIRWKSITSNALNTPSYTDNPTTPLELWSAGIWARNTYR
jgi:hypothetical protein